MNISIHGIILVLALGGNQLTIDASEADASESFYMNCFDKDKDLEHRGATWVCE